MAVLDNPHSDRGYTGDLLRTRSNRPAHGELGFGECGLSRGRSGSFLPHSETLPPNLRYPNQADPVIRTVITRARNSDHTWKRPSVRLLAEPARVQEFGIGLWASGPTRLIA
jgi:hypothetical protein